MEPITRKEQLIADIVAGSGSTEIDAVDRIEVYLTDIIEGNVSTLEPRTRTEAYLAKISGADVDLPVPLVRTRIEMYLARIAGEDVEPPEPITRLEYFLSEWAEGAGFEWATVSGTLPLTLDLALEKALKSLTQYGLTYQQTTPTPSAPVDLVCNNGTLKMIDDELPAGYKRIKSIKFDGDFLYNTGEVLTGNDDVTMTLSGTSTTGQNVFGSYNGTASGTKNFSLYLYGGGSSSNCYFRYGSQLVRPRYGDGEKTITFGVSGTSGFATDVSVTPDDFTTEAPAYIGMLPNSSSPAYTGTIVGNVLVGTRLKWVPCERQTDGVIGYYEAVKGNFIAPTGTGTPVKGEYDGSHYYSEPETTGTPESLALGTQTAVATDLLSVGDNQDEMEIISGLVTRRVGLKVLDGTETGWALSDSGTTHRFRGTKPSDCVTPSNRAEVVSTHFKYNATGQATGGAFIGASSYWYFIPTDQTIDTAEKWREWLAAQYAAGTPVMVLYPLAEEATGHAAPQSLKTSAGINTLTGTINVSAEFEAVYAKSIYVNG